MTQSSWQVIVLSLLFLVLSGQAQADRAIVRVVGPDDRTIAMTIARPATGAVKAAVLFSPGANLAPAGYYALFDLWAARGLFIVAPLHEDAEAHPDRVTDDRARVWRTRLEDMRAANAVVSERIPDVPVMAAGHSYGALIAQALAGAAVIPPGETEAVRPQLAQIRRVVALSPPPVFPGFLEADAWVDLRVPMLVQTGTDDILLPFVARWQQHRASFDGAASGDNLLVVYEAVDHYFNGRIGRLAPDVPATAEAAFAHFADLAARFMLAERPGQDALTGAPDPSVALLETR